MVINCPACNSINSAPAPQTMAEESPGIPNQSETSFICNKCNRRVTILVLTSEPLPTRYPKKQP